MILLHYDVIVMIVWFIVSFLLYRSCKQAGHVTTETWMFIGAMSVFWIESPWNWILHVRYNHDAFLLMFPSSWPVLNMADGLPVNAPFVYGLWFTVSAWFAKVAFASRGWSKTTVVIAAVMFGAVFECVAEILIFILPERYAYTHVIPGMAWSEGTPHQYPMDVPIWLALSVAGCVLTLLRAKDVAEGRVLLSTDDSTKAKISRLRAFGGNEDGFAANLVAAIVIYNATYILTMIPALLTRYAELRSVVGAAAPFGHVPWPPL